MKSLPISGRKSCSVYVLKMQPGIPGEFVAADRELAKRGGPFVRADMYVGICMRYFVDYDTIECAGGACWIMLDAFSEKYFGNVSQQYSGYFCNSVTKYWCEYINDECCH